MDVLHHVKQRPVGPQPERLDLYQRKDGPQPQRLDLFQESAIKSLAELKKNPRREGERERERESPVKYIRWLHQQASANSTGGDSVIVSI
uniref:Uncharacterized protein n=1 Tax=Nelumbo nucifera TaxID=4432 RepID=A0A822ZNV8_NELNU|nr:TPA_asm: hypothetical protein HUJ06_002836 [Nelumbo nucifera]